MFKCYKDNRYYRAIKESLNKSLHDKSCVNKSLAMLISEYSHKTILTPGSHLITSSLTYFVVTKLLSNHWAIGFYCPNQLQFYNGIFYYIPNIWRKSILKRKKIFEPFSPNPFIKQRTAKFFLQQNKYEPLSAFSTILSELH